MGKVEEVKGKQEKYGGRLLCWAIKTPTGSAALLPFHVVFHLRGNLCGVLSSVASVHEKHKGINLCLCVWTVIQPLGYFCPKQRLVGDLCNNLLIWSKITVAVYPSMWALKTSSAPKLLPLHDTQKQPVLLKRHQADKNVFIQLKWLWRRVWTQIVLGLRSRCASLFLYRYTLRTENVSNK